MNSPFRSDITRVMYANSQEGVQVPCIASIEKGVTKFPRWVAYCCGKEAVIAYEDGAEDEPYFVPRCSEHKLRFLSSISIDEYILLQVHES